MTFEQAVRSAPDPVPEAFRPGKQALKNQHRAKVHCGDSHRPTGSVDLDECLQETNEHRNSPRWDYGLGYRADNAEVALWIEVHPASTSDVDTVLKKLHWLKNWLREEASDLWSLTTKHDSPFFWLATRAGVHIRPGSPQDRRLRMAGLGAPQQVIQLP